MIIGTWEPYKKIDFIFFYKIILSLQTFNAFTLHLIFNIFPIEIMHLGPTVTTIKVGQVARVYIYISLA